MEKRQRQHNALLLDKFKRIYCSVNSEASAKDNCARGIRIGRGGGRVVCGGYKAAAVVGWEAGENRRGTARVA